MGDVDPLREVVGVRPGDVGMVALEERPPGDLDGLRAGVERQLEPGVEVVRAGASGGAASAHRTGARDDFETRPSVDEPAPVHEAEETGEEHRPEGDEPCRHGEQDPAQPGRVRARTVLRRVAAPRQQPQRRRPDDPRRDADDEHRGQRERAEHGQEHHGQGDTRRCPRRCR